uniref:Uncharacterized protein n=1 Tax=Sphaerodactylus townsendi TaxID=933632 RepID=A0ACB8E6D4_9SAUR
MGSIAVIQHQKVGGKEIIPQEQELSDDSMRSGQMNISSFEAGVRLIDVVELHVIFNQFNGKIRVLTHEKGRNAQMSVSTRPQENVDLERGVEDEKLCEKVEFSQGDTTVITQSVKAVYIDVADPVTAKSSSIPFQVKGDGGEVLLNANFEDEIVWFDMQSAKGITPEHQAQMAEMLAEGKECVRQISLEEVGDIASVMESQEPNPRQMSDVESGIKTMRAEMSALKARISSSSIQMEISFSELSSTQRGSDITPDVVDHEIDVLGDVPMDQQPHDSNLVMVDHLSMEKAVIQAQLSSSLIQLENMDGGRDLNQLMQGNPQEACHTSIDVVSDPHPSDGNLSGGAGFDVNQMGKASFQPEITVSSALNWENVQFQPLDTDTEVLKDALVNPQSQVSEYVGMDEAVMQTQSPSTSIQVEILDGSKDFN